MVRSCCVLGCKTRANAKSKEDGVRFYRFPVNLHKRKAWIRAINRKNWQPNPHSYLCSKHFVSGYHFYSSKDIDYAPSIFITPERKPVILTVTEQKAFSKDVAKIFEEAAKVQDDQEKQSLQHSLEMHSTYIKSQETETAVTHDTPVTASDSNTTRAV